MAFLDTGAGLPSDAIGAATLSNGVIAFSFNGTAVASLGVFVADFVKKLAIVFCFCACLNNQCIAMKIKVCTAAGVAMCDILCYNRNVAASTNGYRI